MSPDTDTAAMARLQSGDDLALNELMDRWRTRVVSYLIRVVANETTAIDLAQETFVRVYRARLSYRPSATFSTWLFAIATNLARHHLRWQRRHPSVSLDDADDETSLHDRLPSASGTPSGDVVKAEQAAAVKQAIGSLPQDLREAVILFEYEDMSHAEIAAVVGCSAKAVETRLYRARQILRQKLQSLL